MPPEIIMRKSVLFILIFLGVVLSSCDTLKFVPEGKYLLNKTKVEVVDTKSVQGGDLKKYIRQTQNSEILGFWKLQLHIYNTAPIDTTTMSRRRLARNAHRMGEAPEVFDEDAAVQSMYEIKKGMSNLGYFDAEVDTVMKIKPAKQRDGRVARGGNGKVWLTYRVRANQPYTIRDVAYNFTDDELIQKTSGRVGDHTKRIAGAGVRGRSLLSKGMLMDADVMNEERQRVANAMRNDGYYFFEKEMLRYRADSAVGNHQVDVEMSVQPYLEELPDTARENIFTRYWIRDVVFHQDTNRVFLRERTLRRYTAIRPGSLYRARDVERTYTQLNSLGVIKYADIAFVPVSDDSLDCHITVSRRKLNSVSMEADGTYSAGDWGIAAGVGYVNKNLFHGAEQLSLNAHCGYEWRQNGGRAIEAKASAKLSFPNRIAVNVEYNYQNRPDEFTRTIVNGQLGYTLRQRHSRWRHSFQILDVSYVRLPWMSDAFRDQFLQPNNIQKYTYEDHFIAGWSYTCEYSSYRERTPYVPYGSFRLHIETAGNVLDGIARLAKVSVREDGTREVGGITYSQYAKVDFDFAYHQIFNPNHRLVYHAAIGCAVPYGNAKTIPFEKRYSSGGANSVRGWTIRSLGPGGYRHTGGRIDYNNQAGDMKIDANIEYRWRVWSFIELAAFTDVGNIWTITEYDNQPHGAISKSMYKELAWSYGLGVRLDFSFFVFRLDMGVRLYDPERLYTDGLMWRTINNGLRWKDDVALHFAIGYPF